MCQKMGGALLNFGWLNFCHHKIFDIYVSVTSTDVKLLVVFGNSIGSKKAAATSDFCKTGPSKDNGMLTGN